MHVCIYCKLNTETFCADLSKVDWLVMVWMLCSPTLSLGGLSGSVRR